MSLHAAPCCADPIATAEFAALEYDAAVFVSIDAAATRSDEGFDAASVPIPKFACACGGLGRTSESIRTLASVCF
jgi:hypothetical protein